MQRASGCVHCQPGKQPGKDANHTLACTHCRRRQDFDTPPLVLPALIPPHRRRRAAPERDLLRRIRRYEHLLRRNRIDFGPRLQGDHPADDVKAVDDIAAFPSPCDSGDDDIKESIEESESPWSQPQYDEEAHCLLVGERFSPAESQDMSLQHPEPTHIDRLWQIYLENVNPILRVTHTPTLEIDIHNAITVENLVGVAPGLEALMFSIYCVAINSLSEAECLHHFNTTHKSRLLADYQSACRRALSRCRVLRSDNRNCLTALFLYLVGVCV